jgi:hypothetical protein
MHIHGSSMHSQANVFHTAAQGQRAAAAERAAETRRKLLKKSAKIDASSDSATEFLVGHWLDQPEDQLPYAHRGGDDFE